MKVKLVCLLLFLVCNFSLAQHSREEKLEQLKSRSDIKVTEIEKDIIRIEYPQGKVIFKNVGDYSSELRSAVSSQYPTKWQAESSTCLPAGKVQKPEYSPTFDSTIIDLTIIDTTLYYQKYSLWKEVNVGESNFAPLIGDVNNNNLPEIYGTMKSYLTDFSDIVVMEKNGENGFDSVYRYDSTIIARSIYDVDKDGEKDIHIISNELQAYPGNSYLFYKKLNDSALATVISFIFYPFGIIHQQNDNYFGDWDGDEFTDQIFISVNYPPSVNIYEYSPSRNNFDSVYQFDYSLLDLYYGGFSIRDFDQDGKTEFLAGSLNGKVLSIENCGGNCYSPNWEGMVETYNAYLCAGTNDLDGNGKKEIWIGGDAFYNGVGITRITIFEASGNNTYQAVGRVDLVGVFSFDAGNVQVLDVDKDGIDEIMFCIDQRVVILKFNGSINHQLYKAFYIKQNDLSLIGRHSKFHGATMYDITGDGKEDIVIHMDEIDQVLGYRLFTFIYKADFVVGVQSEQNTPEKFLLFHNYPNPFNPLTNIKFELSNFSLVKLKVYNILGKEIATLLEDELSPGKYTINWEAKDSNGLLLPSGVYLIRLYTENYTKTIKALLLK